MKDDKVSALEEAAGPTFQLAKVVILEKPVRGEGLTSLADKDPIDNCGRAGTVWK
jgi:hypothetical protein